MLTVAGGILLALLIIVLLPLFGRLGLWLLGLMGSGIVFGLVVAALWWAR